MASLAQEWALTIGATLRGGHAALVVEATLADGTAAVLKVGVPGTRRDLTFEATALRLADGFWWPDVRVCALSRGQQLPGDMVSRLMDGLTGVWEKTLDARASLSPGSPVAVLDRLLQNKIVS